MEIGGLVVGLGNPGKEYAGTRHNMGFAVVEEFLRSVPAEKVSNKFKALLWRVVLPGTSVTWLFAMPQTYMNKSGEPTLAVMQWYKVPVEKLLVIHDELDLPVGRIKFKPGGGVAGHNGLKSLASCLGTQNFYKLRMGIGRPAHILGADVAPYVLGRFAPQEREIIEKTIPLAVQAVQLFMEKGPVQATNIMNTREKSEEKIS